MSRCLTRIKQKLLKALVAKTQRSERHVYWMISKKVRQTALPRHLAAIALAADLGINISRFATEDELRELRLGTQVAATAAPIVTPAPSSSEKKGKAGIRRERKRGISVFVVAGRDEKIRRALFALLRSLGLKPIEWRKAIEYTGEASPYVGDILDAAFEKATAIVVLLTPDEEARLKPIYAKASDSASETDLRGQPRPNVLFEAGMAFGSSPKGTVLLQVGDVRPFSDVAGRHVVHLTNSADSRQELITKLKNCGCLVDESGSDWLTEGDFTLKEEK